MNCTVADNGEPAEGQLDGRVAELVLLHSMYPRQLDLDDAQLLTAIQAEDVTVKYSRPVTGLFLVNKALEVSFVLPLGYPENGRPTVHCRLLDGSFSRSLQNKVNEDVAQIMAKGDVGLIEILQTTVRLWDDQLLEAPSAANDAQEYADKRQQIERINSELFRYWIYSHHIKSKVKRKLIIDLCANLGLKGVMLIGKPGFICIEGSRRDCDNWWRQIRVLTWQRISLIDTETLQEEGKVPAFDSFDEHSDRSAVFSLLHNKSCDGILKNFLGICAKPEQGK